VGYKGQFFKSEELFDIFLYYLNHVGYKAEEEKLEKEIAIAKGII